MLPGKSGNYGVTEVGSSLLASSGEPTAALHVDQLGNPTPDYPTFQQGCQDLQDLSDLERFLSLWSRQSV